MALEMAETTRTIYYNTKFLQYGKDSAYEHCVFSTYANQPVNEGVDFDEWVDDYIISVPDFMSVNDFKAVFSNRLRDDFRRACSVGVCDD